MTITTGAQLGAYEMIAPLGAGGMSEVYRAKDTRLDRDEEMRSLAGAVTRSHPISLVKGLK